MEKVKELIQDEYLGEDEMVKATHFLVKQFCHLVSMKSYEKLQGDGKFNGMGQANNEINEDGAIDRPDAILTKDIIRTRLSHIARTLDTFEFAYSRYDGRNKNLTNIDIIGTYVHLRVIDLSGNKLQSFHCLASVKHLLVLIINDNLLESLQEIPELSFLQGLSAKGNMLTSGEGLFMNSLTYLQLSSNKISDLSTFNFQTFPNLMLLELRDNSLQSLEGLDLPTLTRLFVAQNNLTNLEGLEKCVSLSHLHARDNKISKLENFPKLENLEYVNLRQNNLNSFSQAKFLGNSPNIRTLITMDNPISSLNDYKIEMIAINPNLKRIDKEPVTEIDLVQGRQIRTGREKGVIPEIADNNAQETGQNELEQEEEEEIKDV